MTTPEDPKPLAPREAADGGTTSTPVGPTDPGRPHVVMCVGNDVRTDNRVRRSAVGLARAGVRVTVVGYAPDGHRQESWLGDVRIVRVPVLWRRRDARRAAMARRRARRVPLLGYPSPQAQQAARLRVTSRLRDLADVTVADPIPRRALRKYLGARLTLIRARASLDRRAQQAVRNGYSGWAVAVGKVAAPAPWRHVLPEVDDLELAFGPVIDALRPDVVHAHDVHMLPVGVRAARRAAAAGRTLLHVYDAHEWVPGLSQYVGRTRRQVAAWANLERDYIRAADHVVTVSPQLAERLEQRYGLRRRPTVVLNIPEQAPDATLPSLREVLGLAPDVPLLVYSGGVQEARGVQTAVAALPLLPEAHLAVVAVPHARVKPVELLLEQARTLGVDDRVHALDPVAPDAVSAFLSTADVGLIPLRHFGSHEVALANKLFEYLHARLPLVVSDCEAQARFVEAYGIGEVHRADDPEDLARAVRTVLAERSRYVKAEDDPTLQDTYTWERQVEALAGAYRDLLGDRVATRLAPATSTPIESSRSRAGGEVVLAMGPANSAGQAWQWTRAAARHLTGVRPCVLAVRNGKLDFPADRYVEPGVFAGDTSWALAMTEQALESWTHVLLEAGRPLFGTVHGRTFAGDAAVLRSAGIEVGLVFHGSEIRDPRRHAEMSPHSPFRDPREPLTARLQEQLDALRPVVESFDGPRFVSTPDLLDFVPGAAWLPVVVDLAAWQPGPEPMQRAVPVVVHAPSNLLLKGTDVVDAVLRPLAEAGAIEYRRLDGTPPEGMAAALADADVVVDQLRLGAYGVLACEAMAAGRVTVAHVDERCRSRLPLDLPVVEATPDTFRAVIERVLSARDEAAAVARRGPAYVREVHDGRLAAEVLGPFLGRRPEAP